MCQQVYKSKSGEYLVIGYVYQIDLVSTLQFLYKDTAGVEECPHYTHKT